MRDQRGVNGRTKRKRRKRRKETIKMISRTIKKMRDERGKSLHT